MYYQSTTIIYHGACPVPQGSVYRLVQRNNRVATLQTEFNGQSFSVTMDEHQLNYFVMQGIFIQMPAVSVMRQYLDFNTV